MEGLPRCFDNSQRGGGRNQWTADCPARAFEQTHLEDPGEVRLWRIIFKHVHKTLSADEIVGVEMRDLQETGLER
ncbi:MAG TPA: hypothetical protein VI451_10335 [Anaerolineales bacterium]|nr:hypothetical protein [Anaerolineales bacterium]